MKNKLDQHPEYRKQEDGLLQYEDYLYMKLTILEYAFKSVKSQREAIK